MIFIPLGLYTRLYRIPWITCLLLLVTVIISYQNFEPVGHFEKTYLRSEHQMIMLQKKLQMLALLCQQESILKPKTCEAVEQESKKPVSSLSQPLFRIVQNLHPHKLSNSELSELQAYLWTDRLFKEHEAQLMGTSVYQEWRSEKEKYNQEANAEFEKNQLLSKGNLNPLSVLKAQFVHGGYMHLIGNLLFFIFMSIFVEFRLGGFLYGLLYLVCGSFGLVSHLMIMDDPSIPLMGASANIAGIAGAFTVFFWKKNIKVLGSLFFVYNRTFSLPVYFFFPVLVFSGDLVGALNAGQAGVAHFAHLSGFVMGAALAYVLKKVDKLPESFAFPEEFFEYQRVKQIPPEKSLESYLKILEINRENFLVHQKILDSFPSASQWASLSPEQKTYVIRELPTYLRLEKKREAVLQAILEKMDASWPLKKVFEGLTGKELKRLIESSEQKPHSASILMEALFQKFPQLRNNPDRSNYVRPA